MPMPRTSLWGTIPASVRAQLIPILTTLFLVKAGQSTAELVVRAHDGTPFCNAGSGIIPPTCTLNSVAVADVQGVLLLLNLVVVLWFARIGLKEAFEKPGEIKLDVKLVGLGTAFATCLELYDYATKSGFPERIILELLAVLYVFIVPFFLVEGEQAREGEGAEDRSRRTTAQAVAAFELVIYAVMPCVFAALCCALFYVVLNEGISIFGHSLMRSVIDTVPRHVPGRVEFWGFNPAFLGVGWLPAILLCAVRGTSSHAPSEAVLGFSKKLFLLAATAAIGMLLAVALIANGSLIPGTGSAASWPLREAKATMAIAILAAFLVAFSVARLTRSLPNVIALPLQIVVFAAMGAAAAGVLAGLRGLFASPAEHVPTLITIHAAGFVVALLGGRVGLVVKRRWNGVHPHFRCWRAFVRPSSTGRPQAAWRTRWRRRSNFARPYM
ncbi:hypothetical protein, partial [Methylobacterium sp. J-077]|uniref:hypothetical protein n=1 Tax=Methylobacterium sp. J-077 TaxID=2836656 RepID=UPI001FB871F9